MPRVDLRRASNPGRFGYDEVMFRSDRSDGEGLDMPRARLSVTSTLPYAMGYDAAIAANTLRARPKRPGRPPGSQRQ